MLAQRTRKVLFGQLIRKGNTVVLNLTNDTASPSVGFFGTLINYYEYQGPEEK
jgi:hypothetical protein